ncbi:MAG: leucine--tRNA ligase [Candidatus Moraniibacteriota bacterium]
MNAQYDPNTIEKKWQTVWEKEGHPRRQGEKGKYYALNMFPYPSGDGLHVGHVENFTATDTYARFKRFQGYSVLDPIGWDAFGLPAENFAIKTGIPPVKKTLESIENFRRQLKSIGLSYDWDREISTSDPEYYRWTQWMFLFLYQHGLAYKKKALVNWCPSCQTVLANEQVVDGKCERSGDLVIQKELEQWFFKITDFLEDTLSESGEKIPGLLSGLEKIDWPESTKQAQRNWIGRSEGAEVVFYIAETEEEIRVFTTRLDTIYGCTYVVLAPEHPILKKLGSQIENNGEVEKYLADTQKKTDLERTDLAKEKTGVFLDGVEVAHPFTGKRLPVFVADYVLSTYGTGAVMGVPAHDERDFVFAKKYDLELTPVILPTDGKSLVEGESYTEDGVLTNSGEFTELVSSEAREKMSRWLEQEGLGKRKVNYRMRDWLISRQRYWGAPIPIVYCEKDGIVPVPEKDLPVKLPTDVDFRPTGESPLARSKEFHDAKCPICGGPARRESDTMDTFVCSSWYYLRFADPHNDQEFASREALEKYLPVDFYMGGAEHTVLHLLYARFFTKALWKYGYLGFDEPFLRLRHQGIILGEDGNKMSKSKGNVVNPDQIIEEFGADSLRLYEMFMGPLDDMKAWSTAAVVGPRRFLDRVWRLQKKISEGVEVSRTLETQLHQTIKKVTEDLETLHFNTAVSALMILLNSFEKEESVSKEHFKTFTLLLAPLAPHIAEELWHELGNKESIFLASWPAWDEKKTIDEMMTIVVQINGRVRGSIVIPTESEESQVKELALADAKIRTALGGKEVKKTIYVSGKILSLVT